MTKKYFTEVEALERVVEVLESGFDGYLCDIHHEVFNVDYYIIGTHKAKKALEQYGVFNAIEKVTEYLKNYGDTKMDYTNTEDISNMLWYIVGEEALNAVNSNTIRDCWDTVLDDDEIKQVIQDIKKHLEGKY